MSQKQNVPFLTPAGRMLWGSLYEADTTDFEGNTLKPNDDGTPGLRYGFGFAIPKTAEDQGHWANTAFGRILYDAGKRDHPLSADRDDFSWKVADGDSTRPGKPYKGKPGRAPCEKEGYPGHWVFSFGGSYAPKVVNANGSAYIIEPNAVVPGDWIQVAGSTRGNDGATPGIYVNYDVISLQWKGVPIVTGVNPASIGFGNVAKPSSFVAPTGSMIAPPVAGAPAPVGQPVGHAGVPNAAAGIPVPASVPATSPGAPAAISPSRPVMPVPQVPVQARPGFLASAVPAAPVAPVPVAPVPTGPMLNPALAAQGVTWEAMLAQNWTVETARAAGHLIG